MQSNQHEPDRSVSGDGEAGAPDDVRTPQPTSDKWLGTVGKTMIAVGLGGIAFFAIVGHSPRRRYGARASTRLELERRRAEIERAIEEAERLSAGARSEEEAPLE